MNHQIDTDLMVEIGREFIKRFQDAGITKVLTIETSGIAPSFMLLMSLGCRSCLPVRKVINDEGPSLHESSLLVYERGDEPDYGVEGFSEVG